MTHVWQDRFKNRQIISDLNDFNSSIQHDQFLFQEEIDCSRVYAACLKEANVLSNAELDLICQGLTRVEERITQGEDLSKFEDIHSAVELMLTEEIGQCGKKIHTGRSRNEQVVTIERLFLKRRIPEILELLNEIQCRTIDLAEKNFNVLMPGYTHLQQAQCVLFSHYIMMIFWQMQRGKERVTDAWKRVDVCTLGVGALAGSAVALDRFKMKELLGFSAISENSMDSVADRSYILEILFAFSMILLDLSRFAEDFCVFSTKEFSFLELADEISTSSSLLPQKRNPDFFELIRSKAGLVFSSVCQLFIALKGLPHTYNKDLQDDKVAMKNGIDITIQTLKVFSLCLGHLKIKPQVMADRIDPGLFALDLVGYLLQKEIPFRDAHAYIGKLVNYTEENKKRLDQLTLDELKQFYDGFSEDVFQVFDLHISVENQKTYGSTAPSYVKIQLEKAKKLVSYGNR